MLVYGSVLDRLVVGLEDTPVVQRLVVDFLVLVLALQFFLPVDLLPDVPILISTVIVLDGVCVDFFV